MFFFLRLTAVKKKKFYAWRLRPYSSYSAQVIPLILHLEMTITWSSNPRMVITHINLIYLVLQIMGKVIPVTAGSQVHSIGDHVGPQRALMSLTPLVSAYMIIILSFLPMASYYSILLIPILET